MYIRTKTRKKRNATFTYAYLVSSKYKKSKRSPRQKVKAYLGRVFVLEKTSTDPQLAIKNIKIEQKEPISPIKKVILKELANYGFSSLTEKILISKKPEIAINIESGEIVQTKNNKKACLKLDLGYLSSHNFKGIWNYRPPIGLLPMQMGKHLAKSLLSAGIVLNQETFINLFNDIATINNARQSSVNNDQQQSTMKKGSYNKNA